MIRFRPFALTLLLLAGAAALALAQAPAAATTSAQPFVVEYYYKTKWGDVRRVQGACSGRTTIRC